MAHHFFYITPTRHQRSIQLYRRLLAPAGRRAVHCLSPPPAVYRQCKAIILAAFLAAKMAVPICIKKQKGYYFHCLVE